MFRHVHTCKYPKICKIINKGTLDFATKIKTIDHIGLILSVIHIHPMPYVSCKFGNDIKKKIKSYKKFCSWNSTNLERY